MTSCCPTPRTAAASSTAATSPPTCKFMYTFFFTDPFSARIKAYWVVNFFCTRFHLIFQCPWSFSAYTTPTVILRRRTIYFIDPSPTLTIDKSPFLGWIVPPASTSTPTWMCATGLRVQTATAATAAKATAAAAVRATATATAKREKRRRKR